MSTDKHLYLIMIQPEQKYAVVIGENYAPSQADVDKLAANGYLLGATSVTASLTITPFPQTQEGLKPRVREYAVIYPKLDLRYTQVQMIEI